MAGVYFDGNDYDNDNLPENPANIKDKVASRTDHKNFVAENLPDNPARIKDKVVNRTEHKNYIPDNLPDNPAHIKDKVPSRTEHKSTTYDKQGGERGKADKDLEKRRSKELNPHNSHSIHLN